MAVTQALMDRQERFSYQPASRISLHVEPPQRSHHSVSSGSWILLAVCCLFALIPGLGFAIWIIAPAVLLVTFILGCVAISRGGVLQGVFIIFTTLVGAPLFITIAPIVTTAIALAISEAQ